MHDDAKKRILDRKWKRLEGEGFERPKDAEENRRRAMEARIDGSVNNIDDSRRSEQARRLLEAKRIT